MTTKGKKYPTRIECDFAGKTGFVVLDQIRTVDKRRLIKHLSELEKKTQTDFRRFAGDVRAIIKVEAVIFIGIQGAGKSTFFKQRFIDTHIRINGDMLRTKYREQVLIEACLKAKQSFVVDKTNATREQRAHYIAAAKANHFRVVGYYFRSNFAESFERNNLREGKAKIPEKGLRHFPARLEKPYYAEGFDQLFYVRINETGDFVVEKWTE